MRRIHKRRLNRSSDDENSNLSLSTPPSSPFEALNTENSATIPDTLVSYATLKYLGFTEAAADHIWARWTNWPPGLPGRFEVDSDGETMFIEVAAGHLTRGRDYDAFDDNDQAWYQCMSICGINAETQASLMDPLYKTIRLTESCCFWIKDTIELRYRGLEAVQKASRERAMALQRAASRPGQSGSIGRAGSSLGSSSTAGQRSISGTMRTAPGMSSDTAFSTATLSRKNSPGSITVFKGIDQARLDGFFNDSGEIVNWSKLFSAPPTDFLRTEAGFYFAVDRDIAVRYACWAKRRDGVSSVVVIHLIVPNQMVESLSDTQLQKAYWPSSEWKNLIWHCRTMHRFPTELRKFKQADLIIGTVSSKPNKVYHRMDSPEEIHDRCVLKTEEGRNAVQYVFCGDEGQELLERLRSEALSVHPVSTAEFVRWGEDHGIDLD
jgi:hypothetical protein